LPADDAFSLADADYFAPPPAFDTAIRLCCHDSQLIMPPDYFRCRLTAPLISIFSCRFSPDYLLLPLPSLMLMFSFMMPLAMMLFFHVYGDALCRYAIAALRHADIASP